MLPRRAVSEGQREALRLLCGAHEREAESAALQAGRLRTQHLLGQKDLLIRHLQRHRLLSERLIRGQRQLIQGEARAPRLPRLCPRSHRCGERGDAAEMCGICGATCWDCLDFVQPLSSPRPCTPLPISTARRPPCPLTS